MSRLLNALIRPIRSRRSLLLARGVVFVLALLVVLAAAFLAAWLAARPGWPGWLTLLAYLVPILIGLLIAQGLYRLDAGLAQHRRDMEAGDILEALRRGEDRAFCLYLRPFASTDALETHVTRRVFTGGGPRQFILAGERLEFETELERAVRPLVPLVALGKPLEHEGAGRILVDDHEWQEVILCLMAAARLIILLPAARPGTLWEVEQILSCGYAGKTVIIDPPNRASSREDYDPAARWQEIRLAFARAGYALPADDEGGLIVRFGSRRCAPVESRPLAIDALATMRSFFRRALCKRQAA